MKFKIGDVWSILDTEFYEILEIVEGSVIPIIARNLRTKKIKYFLREGAYEFNSFGSKKLTFCYGDKDLFYWMYHCA